MRKRFFSLGIFLAISILLFIFSNKFSYPFDKLASFLSSPRSILYSMANSEGKPSEIDKLRSENEKLLEKLTELNALKKDNEALRSQFQDAVISSQTLLPAKVIGFNGPLDNPTTLILDQGSKNNVKKGMAVVLQHNLVGKIGNVSAWASELILPVNKNFSTLAVSSSNNSPGIINGEEDFILLNHVVITDTLSKNEIVVTKGEKNKNGVGIPQDLIVGKISLVNKPETQPFQSAIVVSLVNFKKLTTVFIVVQ